MRLAALAALLIAVAVLCGGWGGIQLGGSAQTQTFVSLFTTEFGADNGNSADFEIGVLFTIDSAVSPGGGYVHGVKFHKQPLNTGTHVAHLWEVTGAVLHRTETFVDETAGANDATGWQSQLFTTQGSYKVDPDTEYIVSYTNNKNYSFTASGLAAGLTVSPIVVPSGSPARWNATLSTFPSSSNGHNYWIDVIWSETP